MATAQTNVRSYELRAGDTVNDVPVEAAYYGEDGVFVVEFSFCKVYGAEVEWSGVKFA